MKLLNQYTSRDVPGYVEVLGVAPAANNTVTVNQSQFVETGQKCQKPQIKIGPDSTIHGPTRSRPL